MACGGWIVLALARTGRVAQTIGAEESEVRALAVRDLGSAVTLLACRRSASGHRGARPVRPRDAARYGRGRPGLAAGILAFAAVGAAGLLARRG